MLFTPTGHRSPSPDPAADEEQDLHGHSGFQDFVSEFTNTVTTSDDHSMPPFSHRVSPGLMRDLPRLTVRCEALDYLHHLPDKVPGLSVGALCKINSLLAVAYKLVGVAQLALSALRDDPSCKVIHRDIKPENILLVPCPGVSAPLTVCPRLQGPLFHLQLVYRHLPVAEDANDSAKLADFGWANLLEQDTTTRLRFFYVGYLSLSVSRTLAGQAKHFLRHTGLSCSRPWSCKH